VNPKLTSPEEGTGRQLTLELPVKSPRFLRADFLTGAAPGDPLSTIDSWLASGDEWRLAICGPAGSGKSHLAEIIARALGTEVTPVALDGSPGPIDGRAVYVIDELERLSSSKALLALIEHVRTNSLRIILAGRGLPENWACGLRDLVTRLEAMARIELSDPDEELMRAVILKMFRDRQTRVSADVIDYAAPRLPRTFRAARAFVEAADAAGIQRARAITKSLARIVIDNLSVGPRST